MDRQSELIENIAKKYNTTKAEIEHIYKQEFWYVNQIMQSGEHKGIKLPLFGKFCVKAKRQMMFERSPKGINIAKKRERIRLEKEQNSNSCQQNSEI